MMWDVSRPLCAAPRNLVIKQYTVCRRARVSYMRPLRLYRRDWAEDTSKSDEDGATQEPDAEEELDIEEVIMEAQWKSYVDGLRQSGQLGSCLAVADVSGSMRGQPMNVCSSMTHAPSSLLGSVGSLS